ncbi:MAG TPA: tRNA (adenosine(37)-N6)-dimethylallyltransferase MiaA [Ignavibacteriales bacterium]|nr:tRNA (adenosine(37)-N6)-dimethylallyltransferase MiaA [Ignavibacteriales bacterium]
MGKVIVIIGPTASGKTELSIKIAKLLNTEIISADSRQCYKYLNIGTAKPTIEEQEGITHHFIDCFEPDYRFTAGMFAKQANEIINKLLQQNKNPIIVGGSGLYIEALIDGLQDSCDYDPILRNRLLRDLNLYGTKFLYNQLEIVDPDYASRISSNDWRRILRALEFYYLAQKTFSSLKKEMTSLHDFVIINIVRERSLLYERINSRVDKMMKEGLIDEVKRILDMGYSKELNSLNTVGYKEIIEYLDGKTDLYSAVEKIKKNTRNYAKKQITFFKKFEDRSLNINPDYQRLDFISDILN